MPVGVVAKAFGDRMEARNTLRHRDAACLDFRPFDRIFQPDFCLTVDVASGQALAGRHLPTGITHTILGSFGGALAVAGSVGGARAVLVDAVQPQRLIADYLARETLD